MSEPLSDEQVGTKALAIARAFTPNTPVTERERFAGRTQLLLRIVIAAAQPGQHVVLHGRPGVGKTSLANMIAPSLGDGARVVIVDEQRVDEAAASNPDTTLVIVGSADSADGLAPTGLPFARFVVPPMTPADLAEIIDRNLRPGEMTIDAGAKALIATISHGQPRYTHLLAQHAAHDALLRGRSAHIAQANVHAAMKRFLGEQPKMAAAWQQATKSHRVNLFGTVLLACALAPKHELGWFTANGVADAMRKITKKEYEVRRFSRHLQEFAETRGPILERAGEMQQYFYRFANAPMEAYVVVKAADVGLWNPARAD